MSGDLAVVVGGTSGIGADAAVALARRGYTVVVAGRSARSPDAGLAAAPRAAIVPVEVDVRDASSVERFRSRVLDVHGNHGPSLLLNCAGIAQPGPLEVLPEALLRQQFETNVFGFLRVVRALVPHMRRSGGGRILNVGSIAGSVPTPNLGAYSASKAALEALSHTLRQELAPFGIRVIYIEPGLVRTPFDQRAQRAFEAVPVAGSAYASLIRDVTVTNDRARRVAAGTEPVVRVIVRAARCRRPASRYAVTVNGRLALWLHHLLPTAWWDRLAYAALGYGGRWTGEGRGEPSAPDEE